LLLSISFKKLSKKNFPRKTESFSSQFFKSVFQVSFSSQFFLESFSWKVFQVSFLNQEKKFGKKQKAKLFSFLEATAFKINKLIFFHLQKKNFHFFLVFNLKGSKKRSFTLPLRLKIFFLAANGE
jgi:hypothetical protein